MIMSQIMKKVKQNYNSHPISNSEGKLIDNLNLAKDAVFENIENLLDRNDKIDMIISESNSLKDNTNIISDLTKNLENKESQKKNRYIILADNTEYNGNFSQIVRLLLDKIEKEGKVIMDYDK